MGGGHATHSGYPIRSTSSSAAVNGNGICPDPKRNHSGSSVPTHPVSPRITEADAINLVLPSYYTKEELTKEELDEAMKLWELIVHNHSPHFDSLKKEAKEKNLDFPFESCSDYFSYQFYEGLFEVNPDYNNMFSHSKPKMRVYFMQSMNMLLESLFDDKKKFQHHTTNLAKIHCKIGIRAYEYGVGCEILLKVIHKCVGDSLYTEKMHKNWTKIFSQLLEVLVSVTVRHELSGGTFSVVEDRRRHQENIPSPTIDEVTNVVAFDGQNDMTALTDGNSTHVFHFSKPEDSMLS